MKKNISVFLIIAGLSLALNLFLNINLYIYFIIYFIGFTVIRLNLSLRHNKDFFIKVLLFNLILFWMIIIDQYGVGSKNVNVVEFFILFTIFLDLYITGILLIESNNTEDNSKINVSQKVLAKREEDLKSLEYYINRFDIVGLNGQWGSGKSFLVDQFKEKVKNKYEFIEIDLLTSNLNEIQLTLMNSFEGVLLKNGILPKYTNNLKKNLSSLSFFGKIQNFLSLALNSNELKAGVLKSFIKETHKLKNKKFLIIFEDIDRVENKENLKEIFAISEKLASDNIKIIYQYDEDLLLGKEFSFEYLEKYIPFKINITQLHITEIINFLIEEKLKINPAYLVKEDFNYLYFLSEYRFKVISQILKYNFDINYEFDYLPFRKIENMITEISYTLQKNQDYLKHKEIIISFFVLKHLLPDQFKKLRNHRKTNLLKIFNFKDKDGREYSILEIINHKEESPEENELLVNQIFKDSSNEHFIDNRSNYVVLKLFDYRLYSETIISDRDRLILLKSIEKNNHEKNNRLIQKLLYEGNSILTDHEFAKEKFLNMVLNEEVNQEEKYNEFLSFFFHANQYEVGNRTIFLMGKNFIESLFESFNISSASGEEFMKLLRFYFDHHNKDRNIDLTLLKCLVQMHVETDKQLIELFIMFNSLKVESNFNNENEFHLFLKKMMEELFRKGILESTFILHYEDLVDINPENINKQFLESLKDTISKLQESQMEFKKLNLESIEISLNHTISFLNKIVSMIEMPNPFEKENKPFITSSESVEYKNQKEYDKIINLHETGRDLNEILIHILDSYEVSKITITEVEKILTKLKY